MLDRMLASRTAPSFIYLMLVRGQKYSEAARYLTEVTQMEQKYLDL